MVSGKSIFKNNRNCPCVKSIFINLSCQFTALSQKMLRYINIHTLFRRYLRVPAVCSPLPQIAMMLFQIFPWDFSRVIAKSLLCCRVHSVILPFLYYSPVLFFYVIFLCYFSVLYVHDSVAISDNCATSSCVIFLTASRTSRI